MRHGCAPGWGARSATRLDPPGARPPLVIGGSTIRSGQPSPWLRVRLDRRLQRARRSPGRPSRMAGWKACPQGPELDLPGMARGPLIQGRSWYGARRCGSTGKLKPFSVGVGRQRKVLQDWALILIIDGDRGHLAGASSGLADLTWRTFRPTGQIRNMADVMRLACAGMHVVAARHSLLRPASCHRGHGPSRGVSWCKHAISTGQRVLLRLVHGRRATPVEGHSTRRGSSDKTEWVTRETIVIDVSGWACPRRGATASPAGARGRGSPEPFGRVSRAKWDRCFVPCGPVTDRRREPSIGS
jgi:hypothetical protein